MDLDRFCKIVSVITVVVLKEVNVAFVMWSWGKHWDRPGCAVWVGLAAGADVAWTRCAGQFLRTALRRVGRLHSRQTNTFWLERNTQNSYALNSSLISDSIPQCTAHLPWAFEFTDSGLCRTAPIISVAGVDGKAVFAVALESLFTLTLKLPIAKWTLRISIANSLRTHAWNMIETDDDRN